jgi:HAD superfamily hydrolase (TIGR01509 family)
MQTIIFDFGNVVGFFDHARTLEKLQPFTDWTPEAMFASVYKGDLEDRFERGQMTAPQIVQHIHELWQLRCDPNFLVEAIGDIFTPNPEVCELIPQLAGRYRLLLGSNTNAIHSAHFIAQFADVLSHFDGLILSHEIGTRKPDAGFFKHCHGEAKAPAASCVFVDDLADNIAGARAVGFHGIEYRPGEDLAGKLRGLGVDI